MPDGGIVLDLKDMHALEIDPKTRTAWAETGLTAVEYSLAADAHGLATGFGDTGSVGIGGVTPGGGGGFFLGQERRPVADPPPPGAGAAGWAPPPRCPPD